MHRFMRATAVAVAAVLMLALAGCSPNLVIWGPKGSAVIDATERFIAAVVSGSIDDSLCPQATPNLGDSSDWLELSAGEPERFNPKYWREQVALHPDWNINLELSPSGVWDGRRVPSYLFFREADGKLCVVDVVWGTIEVGG